MRSSPWSSRKGSSIINIQVFGVKKCFDTNKAMRYFKERNIRFQFVDLSVKGLSKGELQSVKAAVGHGALFDASSKDYTRLNLHRIVGQEMREEILLANPSVCKTPIVRNGRQATVGYAPETWSTWE